MGVAKVQNINKTSPIGHDNRFLFGAQLPASTHKLQNQLPTCRHCERDYARPNVAFFDDDLGSNARSCLDSTWTCHDISKKKHDHSSTIFWVFRVESHLENHCCTSSAEFPRTFNSKYIEPQRARFHRWVQALAGSSGGSAGDRVRLYRAQLAHEAQGRQVLDLHVGRVEDPTFGVSFGADRPWRGRGE